MQIDKNIILEHLSLLKNELSTKGIVQLGLFGSFAKDNQTIYSDIDIAIKKDKSFLEKNGVYDVENLRYIMKNNENIKNYKLLDELLNDFTIQVYDKRILDLKDYLGFIKFDKKEDEKKEDKEILFFELFVKVSYLKQFAKAYYILNKNGGVEYFEFSFK